MVAKHSQNSTDTLGISSRSKLSETLTFPNICYEHLRAMLPKIKSQ